MITTFHDFSRLGTSKQFDNHDQNDIIAINKLLSSLTSEASAKAKRNSCPICGKDCTSFCSSHSVPRFVLHNIAENGCVSAVYGAQRSPFRFRAAAFRSKTAAHFN